MICLRCGYCCRNYAVVLPDGTIHEGGSDCKFLTRDGPLATCTVHGKDSVITCPDGHVYRTPWEETPCGRHTQIERGNQPCRMGQYVLEKELLR
jgi:hypothetical protein